MKLKTAVKLIADILMTAGLLFLMSYSLTGEGSSGHDRFDHRLGG